MEKFREDNRHAFDFQDFLSPNGGLCACYKVASMRPDREHDPHLGGDDEDESVNDPIKQRKGDQRLPDSGADGLCVQDEIIAMMEESKRVGIERYGQTLKPFNGRRGTQDLVEEARDLLVYAMQLHMEANASGDQLFWAICQGLIEARNKVEGFELGDFAMAESVARLITDRVMASVALKYGGDLSDSS
jgi:hypothetical protein